MKRVRQYRNAAEVAAILDIINPHGYTEDSLISAADNQFHKEDTVFFGTGGWYCTFYPVTDPNYTHEAVFTLMPYSVAKYLEDEQLRKY